MIEKILVASNNTHKVDEIRTILSDLDIDVISLKEAGIEIDVAETGSSFSDNSLIKAKAIAKLTDLPVLADDSGLLVPWLRGEPGVHSARYAGEESSDTKNKSKLIKELKNRGIKFTDAYFICVMTFVIDEHIEQFEGICSGQVKDISRGTNGFGYDALFYSGGSVKSFAEISALEKDKISHRALALNQLKDTLKKLKF